MFQSHEMPRDAVEFRRQPGWLAQAAVIVFLIIVGLPLVLLVLAALFAATLLFALLWTARRLVLQVRSMLPARDGRENVRVIPPHH